MKDKWIILVTIIIISFSKNLKPVYTQVTSLYNIDTYQHHFSFEEKLKYFNQILQTDMNLIIFGESQIEYDIWRIRERSSTIFIKKPIDEIKKYFKYSFQKDIKLKDKEILQRSKLFLLYEALSYDRFNSDFLIWTDAIFTSYSPKNYIAAPEFILKSFYQFFQPQWIFNFQPQKTFDRYQINPVIYKPSSEPTNFGGYSQVVRDAKSIYENYLRILLQNGQINTVDKIFYNISLRYPQLFPFCTNYSLDVFRDQRLRIRLQKNRKSQHHHSIIVKIDDKDSLSIKNIINIQKRVEMKVQKFIFPQRQSSQIYFKIFYTKFTFAIGLFIIYIYVVIKLHCNKEIKQKKIHKQIIQNQVVVISQEDQKQIH